MKKLLFALLLSGCVTTINSSRQLPESVVGEWVSPDFEVANNEAEPDAGTVFYIAEDGLATLYTAPIAGTMFKATYKAATYTVVLQSLVAPDQEGPSITMTYVLDPSTKILTLQQSNPPRSESDLHGLRTFKRRRPGLPTFIQKSFQQRRALGSPHI